ncbi:hypothetical protein WN873_04625 [Tetragenococcus halophilus]|uniref:hypothetical protein n=1 Tax=Tetragenococcus halophilus TaxID=51669 RepID=UPI0030F3441E
MSKRILSLLFATSLLLASCGGDKSDLTVEDAETKETEKVEETEKETEEEKTESIEGSRSNPVPIDKKVSQDFEFYNHDDDSSDESYEGNRSITLSNFTRGEEVYNYLMEANQFNEEAPEGMEWAIIDVEYILNEAESEDVAQYVMPEFSIIDSNGSEVAQNKVYPSLDRGNEYGHVELYSGGTAKGKYAFYVPVDDDILIKYDDWNAKAIFFNPN